MARRVVVAGRDTAFIARTRILAAGSEALAAGGLTWLAWWCWHRGVIVTWYQGLPLHRIEGRWWAAATAAATLAGILLLDALRESACAVTSHPEPRRRFRRASAKL